MSSFWLTIRGLISKGASRISEHGFQKLRQDDIHLVELLQGLETAQIVEEYPDYHKGPCVLVFQRDAKGGPVHVLWGTSTTNPAEATLITAYRPDPKLWSADFLRRLPK